MDYPVRYGYDTQGCRTSLATTRDGSTWDETRWAYDPRSGVCLSKMYADGSAIAYTYTDDELLRRTTYASGKWTENIYDDRRQVVGTRSSDGEDDVAVEHDVFGRIVAESNGVACARYALADSGTATNEVVSVGGESVVIGRTLDGCNRPSGLEIESNGYSLHYSYDSKGKLAFVSNALAVVRYRYTTDLIETAYFVALNDGMTVDREIVRDPARRELVDDVSTRIGRAYVERFFYGYDAAGRPVARNGDRFGYNARSEVVSAQIAGNSAAYGYDEIGNSISHSAIEADTVATEGQT